MEVRFILIEGTIKHYWHNIVHLEQQISRPRGCTRPEGLRSGLVITGLLPRLCHGVFYQEVTILARHPRVVAVLYPEQ